MGSQLEGCPERSVERGITGLEEGFGDVVSDF